MEKYSKLYNTPYKQRQTVDVFFFQDLDNAHKPLGCMRLFFFFFLAQHQLFIYQLGDYMIFNHKDFNHFYIQSDSVPSEDH